MPPSSWSSPSPAITQSPSVLASVAPSIEASGDRAGVAGPDGAVAVEVDQAAHDHHVGAEQALEDPSGAERADHAAGHGEPGEPAGRQR